jgi:NarL family two-component system response regulator LiaR
VIGEARDGAEALLRAHELHPDVVLIDLLMPVMDGIAAIGAIRRELPDIEVIALTSVLDDSLVIGAVRAGAIGSLLKDAEADDLCRAIKAAAAGQVQRLSSHAQRACDDKQPLAAENVSPTPRPNPQSPAPDPQSQLRSPIATNARAVGPS